MTQLNDHLAEPSELSVLAVFPVQGSQASLFSLLLLLAICTPRIWGSSGNMAANRMAANQSTSRPCLSTTFPGHVLADVCFCVPCSRDGVCSMYVGRGVEV